MRNSSRRIDRFRVVFEGWFSTYKKDRKRVYRFFDNWNEAQKNSMGYDNDEYFQKVFKSSIKVKNGFAKYERDSVLFFDDEIPIDLIECLEKIASFNDNSLNIIDYGGSLGSVYFQCKNRLEQLSNIKWNIIEQKKIVEIGKRYFQTDTLQFFSSLDECLYKERPNSILFSGVLQYLENPYGLLSDVIKKEIPFIIIRRTPMIRSEEKISVQEVFIDGCHISYPSWFLNCEKMMTFFSDKQYTLVYKFTENIDGDEDLGAEKAKFLGYFFIKRDSTVSREKMDRDWYADS
jgi:putative methyltransferase (TIGR04325 family)